MKMALARIPNRSFDIQLALALSFVALGGFGVFLAIMRPPLMACTLKRISGISCPTCGSTRAAGALLHFDFLSAFLWNPLVMVLAAGIFCFTVQVIVARVFRLSRLHLLATRDERRGLVMILAAALIVNWGYLIWAGV